MNLSMNLDGKKFKALHNSDNGEVGSETIFSYRQNDDVIWATYEGGSIKFGTLSGCIEGLQLIFNYQHQNFKGEFLTGHCTSEMKLVGGKIQLHETWQWTCLDFSKGESVLEEITEFN